MSQTAAKRAYRATFILDTREYEETIESLIEHLSESIGKLEGEVTNVNNLSRKDFVRVTDRNHPGDFYLQLEFEGPPSCPAAIRHEFRLDKRIKCVFVEAR